MKKIIFGILLLILNAFSINIANIQTKYLHFTRDNNANIVNDTLTTLMWQDTQDNQSLEVDWYEAKAYCKNLKLDNYTDWRLPSRLELFSISREADKIFKYKEYDFYWSSSVDLNSKIELINKVNSNEHAFGVYFSSDLKYKEIGHLPTFYTRVVRCVRGGKKYIFGNLSRDDNTNTVIDKSSNLVWQDSKEIKTTSDIKVAQEYCKNLKLGDLTNWRLPSMYELLSISDDAHINPAIFKEFKNTKNTYYWTSSKVIDFDTKEPILVSFGYGGFAEIVYENTQYAIRCVANK